MSPLWRRAKGSMRTPDPRADAARPARLRRLAWFVGLWAASVGVVGLVGYAIRLVLKP